MALTIDCTQIWSDKLGNIIYFRFTEVTRENFDHYKVIGWTSYKQNAQKLIYIKKKKGLTDKKKPCANQQKHAAEYDFKSNYSVNSSTRAWYQMVI